MKTLVNHVTKISAFALTTALCATAWAQTVEVKDAWARATVQGQKATGAFLKITSKEGSKLVGAVSPVAGVTEVHEMKMQDGVMSMRAVQGGLDLPAGKTVELKPGGYHIMLMDLKLPLQKDTTIALTLMFKDAKGVETSKELKVPVSMALPAQAHGGTDAHQIAAVLKTQFERPDAPLSVEPVTIEGNYAVAGWIQGGKGGRALLQKGKDHWFISVCAGNGLTKADVLQTTGMSAALARKLAAAVNAAETKQTAQKRKLWDSFEGMVKIDPAKGHGASEHHGAHGAHGAHHAAP